MSNFIDGIDISHLTAMQRLFVERYAITRNATESAREAGYKKPNVASQLVLKNEKVAAVIQQIEKKTSERNGLERENVLRRLGCNLNRNLTDLVDGDGNIISDLRDLPPSAHAYVDGLKVKQLFDEEGKVIGQIIDYKLSPNASVQDMAMKHIGGYSAEKHEVKHFVDWDSLLEPPKKKTVEDKIDEIAGD